MQQNPIWLPLIGYGLLTAAGIGGSIWGVRELEAYQERGRQQVDEQRAAREAQQLQQQAQLRQVLGQIQPVMIAGTLVMTGLGSFIMLSGMRRKRRERRRELREAY